MKISHNPEKPFHCHLCDYRAPDKSYLRSHMVGHEDVKFFFCDECDYSTNRANSLRVHVQSRHIGIHPWKCPYCIYAAHSKVKVRAHIKNRHEGRGEVVRRNIIVKFNMDAYRTKKPGKNKVSSSKASLGMDRDVKYMVVEQVPDDAEGAGVILCNNNANSDEDVWTSVGEEVTVSQNMDGEADEPDNITYRCAFCEYQSASIDQVQLHIGETHPCDEDVDVMDESLAVINEDSHQVAAIDGSVQNIQVEVINQESGEVVQVIPENVESIVDIIPEEGVQIDEVIQEQPAHMAEVTEDGQIFEVVQDQTGHVIDDLAKGYHLVQQATNKTVVLVINQDNTVEHGRTDILQDEAVSTAVESILNLQDAS